MARNIKPTDTLVFELKIKQSDINSERKEALREEIAKKYGVPKSNVKIETKPETVSETGEKISLVSEKINSIHIPEYQQTLFMEYLKENNTEGYDFEKILEIDKQVNAYVDFDEYSKYKQYKFKYVKWDNFLSYGKGNYFDFTPLKGIVLLNSYPENQSGKTTFAVELVRFALFGKSNKVPTLESAFNRYLPEETTVMVEAGIEIDGKDYVIRRTLERPALKKRTEKSKVKQTLEYFTVVNGTLEVLENCEGESSTETNNIIKEAVGSPDDFDLVISATQKTLSDLLDLGQTDRSRLFAKWMGLLTIEKKSDVAKKIWKDTISKSLMSNIYNRETLSTEIEGLTNEITDDKKSVETLLKSIDEQSKKVAKRTGDLEETYKKRKTIDPSVAGLDVATIEAGIRSKNDDKAEKEAIIENIKKEYAEKSKIVFDEVKYSKKKSELEQLNSNVRKLEGSNGELRGRIGALRADNERITELMKNSICPTCGHKIEVSEQTGFINNNKAAESELIKQGVSNKNEIEETNKLISKVKDEIASLENDRETVNEAQRLSLRITALNSSLEAIVLSIEKLESQKKLVESNIENVKHNNKIDTEASIIKAEIDTMNRNIARETGEKEALLREIKSYEDDIEKKKKLIEKLIEEEKIVRNWNIYQELVGKNGITKIVLRESLPIINNEIARLVDGVCDFDIRLDMDDKNNVTINLHKNGVVMDMGTCASGFEETVASLALRSALGNMSSLSKSNLIVLDEVLGGVAVSNYDAVHELYKRICSNYQFILHITHNELLADWHEQNITVVKEGDVSRIIFNESN